METKLRKHKIERWLKRAPDIRYHFCPFIISRGGLKRNPHDMCDFCKKLFPRILPEGGGRRGCPCTIYNHKYVLAKVTRYLKGDIRI